VTMTERLNERQCCNAGFYVNAFETSG